MSRTVYRFSLLPAVVLPALLLPPGHDGTAQEKSARPNALARFPVLAPPVRGGEPPRLPERPRNLRLSAKEVIKLGRGSEEKGLNELGRRGLQLRFVTYAENGATQYLYFQTVRAERPVSYRLLNAEQLQKEGDGDFNVGLRKLDDKDWLLRALTQTKTGEPGWHYFMR